MTDVVGMTSMSWRERRQAWPRWVGYATICWAVAYGGFGLGCALTDTPLFYRGDDPGPVELAWLIVALAALAAVAALTAARVLLWVACALATVCAFGLLMDVITLMVNQDAGSAAGFTKNALGGIGAVLLAATARARDAHPATGARPEPSPASRKAHLAAYAGTAAFVPYAAMKVTWAVGGTFAGVSGEEMLAKAEEYGASGLWLTLASWGLDATALLAALGVFLLFGLIRPWGQVFPRWTLVLGGRRVPRWLPLAPALIGAATLAPYGVVGVGYCALATVGAVRIRPGDFPSSADALLVSWIGLGAFAVYGVALTVAARSYWLRTRPA
ncbi:hypothetical protein ACH4U6_10950 [Streptomyces netropsis]|uniref:hypothetical protein n=1 Tax=Streptomyces netropsis TaxID=55404 RepID=UPI00378F3021